MQAQTATTAPVARTAARHHLQVSYLTQAAQKRLEEAQNELQELLRLPEKDNQQLQQIGQLVDEVNQLRAPGSDGTFLGALHDEMSKQGLQQKDLRPVLGSAGLSSQLLNGQKDFTFQQAWRLSQFLSKDLVTVFLREQAYFAAQEWGDLPQ